MTSLGLCGGGEAIISFQVVWVGWRFTECCSSFIASSQFVFCLSFSLHPTCILLLSLAAILRITPIPSLLFGWAVFVLFLYLIFFSHQYDETYEPFYQTDVIFFNAAGSGFHGVGWSEMLLSILFVFIFR